MSPDRRLLHRYLDEIASPAEMAELAGLLANRPDLADALAEAGRTEALLEVHFSERRTVAAAVAALATTTPAPRGRRLRAGPHRRSRGRPRPRRRLPGGCRRGRRRHQPAGRLARRARPR